MYVYISMKIVAIVFAVIGAALASANDSSAETNRCSVVVDPNYLNRRDDSHHPRQHIVGSVFDVTPSLLADSTFNDNEEIRVCFAPGRHRLLGRVWSIGRDMPARVHWTSENYELPASISAGFPLNAWHACNENGLCPGWDGCFVHYIKDVPGFNPNSMPLRNLWVNGTRIERTFVQGEALGLTAAAFGYVAPKPLGWTAGEMRWPRQIKNWIEPRCSATVSNGTEIHVEAECWKSLQARYGGIPPPPAYIENVDGAAPQSGQFFSDSQYIFYRPSGPFPLTSPPTESFIGGMEVLLSADGIKSHSWTNLTFEHGTWDVPSTPGGYVPSQSTVNARGEPLGVLRITNSSFVSVSSCAFANIGGPWALSITGSSQDVLISKNTFRDLSGGAIKAGNIDDQRAVSKNPSDFDARFIVSENSVSGAALEFRGASVIFAGYVADTNISKNSISETSYTGISLGWGWGRVISFARNNHVFSNRIENIMRFLNDGGCIYTLGPQPGSSVRYNYCHSDDAPVVGCFYHDNGSRYFTTEKNVADGSPAPCVYLQGCCNAPALDIHVDNLYCRATAAVRNGCAPQNCTIDNATLHYVDVSSPWPAEAQFIIDQSGAGAR